MQTDATIAGFRLSWHQRLLWLRHHESPAYVAQCAILLDGPLKPARIENALQAVIKRHQILRTTFHRLAGMKLPVQVIAQSSAPLWHAIDLRDQDARQHEATVEALFSQARQQPFDLAKAPLVRATLLTLSSDRHMLLISLPALCADTWTLHNLVREIGHFYATPDQDMDDTPVQYVQFSEWHNALLEGAEAEAGKAYWRQQGLSALPAVLLPFEQTAAETPRGTLESVAVTIAPEVAAAIAATVQRYDTTADVFLLACWQTLLWRITGTSDIVVSSVCDGREFEALHGACGVFAKGVPVQARFEQDILFQTVLQQVHAALQDASEWQAYFTWDEIAGSPDGMVEPTFGTFGFAYEKPVPKFCADGVCFSVYKQRSVLPHCKLLIACAPTENGLTVTADYDPLCLAREHVQRLIGHFARLVQSAVQHPAAPASTLELLHAEARQHLLRAWHTTPGDYPQDTCIQTLFEAQVERTPHAIAVVCEEQRVTYAQLNARANQLAHYLRRCGVEAEVRVGLALERSMEMLIGILGILKAGGAYVPLNPEHPPARLAYQLAEIQAPVLLTREEHVEQFAAFAGTLLCLERDAVLWEHEPIANPEPLTVPQHPVYVMYTSGSTGVPKGVVVTHHSLVHYTHCLGQYLCLPQAARGLHFATVSTITADLGNTCIFPALVSGGCLHVLSYEVATHGGLFARYMTQHAIDVLKIVPSHLLALLASQPDTRAILPRQYLILGGEALSWDLVRRLAALSSTCEVINHYGPTETTVGALTFCVRGHDDGQCMSATVPIGRPIAHTEIYILDRHLQPAPVGVPGELYIGGAGLAQGYLNAPERTAESFVAHPYADQPGARLYKTGDMARYLPDGNVEFLGRADHQVKIRGFRVELTEIEVVLGQHPSVQQAVVVVREDEPGLPYLVAYVMVDSALVPGPNALVAYLRERLPAYMVPSMVVRLDALPLTPNGKIDRQALPAPDRLRIDQTGDGTTPRTPTEELLAGIWAAVFNRVTVGCHDDFFALGGHSLLAMQIAARIREVFQVELPLRSLFDAPTVARLAAEIEAARGAASSPQVPPLLPVPRDRELPLSFAQQRLWFLDQLAPQNAFYNVPIAVRLLGRLDVLALEKALAAIVQRHEILRTTFQTIDGRPVQVIAPTMMLVVQRLDLRGLPEHERDQAVLRYATEEAQQPFDLAQGPLLRATLLHLAEQAHALLVTMHHIVSDFWSRSILTREFAALYQAFTTGQPSPLAALTVQYADFAVWQRQWLQGAVLEQQLAYWRRQLAGSPPLLALPTDHPRPSVQTFRGADAVLALPPDLCHALRELSRRAGVTLFMMLLAAFQILLHRYSGQMDICVGTPIAGRTPPQTEGMIGFFLNTLVVRTAFAEDPSFREVLRRVRRVLLEAYAHQDLPFEQLVEALHPVRDLSHAPVFQVSFSMLNAPMGVAELPGLTIQPFQGESTTAKFDLALLVVEGGGRLTAQMEYNIDLFEAATIARMLQHFTRLLEGIAADPEQRVSDLPLLTAAERQQMLLEWHKTETAAPAEGWIHHLFEAQVERSPDAVAVVCAEAQLTFRALNARANQLAYRLQTLGVGPEVMVGVCAERSLEAVMALWAILKAGGVYVPLDPAYPQERLAFMLRDTRAPVLLTQARLVERLPASQAAVICLDTDAEALAQECPENPDSGVMAENLAYVIYTSGSTGQPKGVLISHGAIVNHCRAVQRHYQLTSDDRILQFAALSFDASLEQMCAPLTVGARLVLRGEEVWTPVVLREQLVDGGLTMLNVPPAYWHQVALEWAAAPEHEPLPLRLVLIGGDVMRAETLHLWWQTPMRTVRLLNGYGPTETTITATTFEVPVDFDVQGSDQHIPIGRALPGRQVYILDSHGHLAPIGVPGELHLGGAYLARGYLNRPDLTAERFIPDHLGQQPGERMYKSGDLARYVSDGSLEFLGRIDNQVKMRGFRIELGEIEAVLGQYPAVQEAVVVVREDEPGRRQLVAYVVAHPSPATAALREFIRQKLPEYMVPGAFVLLEALPLTATGKVNRQALPAPDRVRPGVENAYVAPRTPIEAQLTAIAAQLLGVAQIGVDDNFFDAGGHSLLATQLLARIRATFQVEIPLRRLFENPSIAHIAEAIAQARESAPVPSAPPIERLARASRRVKRSQVS